jgi:chromosome segregation ATPase
MPLIKGLLMFLLIESLRLRKGRTMAKEYPVGAKMYLPVYVVAMESDVVIKPDGNEVRTDARFAYTYAYGEARREGYVRYGQPEGLLTAEEVADKLDLVARATLEEYTEKAEKRIRSLEGQLADSGELLSEAQAKVDELTKADCMRVQEFKPIIEERDKLNGELEQEKKRTQVWKDASEDHRKRAEELEGDVRRYEQDISEEEVKNQRLEQENNSLKAGILELKAQIEVLRSAGDVEALKEKLNARVKITAIHRKAIARLGNAVKEKDLIISLLAARVLELEKGGGQ